MPRIAGEPVKVPAAAPPGATSYWLVDPGPRTIRRRWSEMVGPRRKRKVIYEPFPPPGGGFLLQEDGTSKLLLENGVDAILLE